VATYLHKRIEDDSRSLVALQHTRDQRTSNQLPRPRSPNHILRHLRKTLPRPKMGSRRTKDTKRIGQL